MRAVVQRVTRAQVEVDGNIVGAIDLGFLALVGASEKDTKADADALAKKVVGLRVFADDQDKMNLGVQDVGGSILAVSQFTLLGDCRKGRRPSFVTAARPEQARVLFDRYVEATRALGVRCETGIFRAMMKVELVNDGPVTLLVDTHRLF